MKVFRICYRMEVYLPAETEAEANSTFEKLTPEELREKASFVEVLTTE